MIIVHMDNQSIEFPQGRTFYLTDRDVLIIENDKSDDIGAVNHGLWSAVEVRL